LQQVEDEIELVRRGFDPGQVQQLVGQLSAELKTLAAENDRLRARIAELEHSAAPVHAGGDIFGLWTRETNDLMSAARASIASVTEKATTDAAAAVAAGETAANAIRVRAQLDADAMIAEARRQAEQTAFAAAAAKAATEAEAQAAVSRANAQVATMESKLAELRNQRSTMSQQLSTAKSHLMQLMSLVDEPEDAPAPAATPTFGADAANSVVATHGEAATADERH
jgi:cell division septum initiation protein DivIVA